MVQVVVGTDTAQVGVYASMNFDLDTRIGRAQQMQEQARLARTAFAGPAIFGVSVAQINMMLDTILASFLETGSISWLYYADRLCEFPLGVFGLALSTVILPALSKRHATGSAEDFADTLDWGLRWVFLIGVPSARCRCTAVSLLCNSGKVTASLPAIAAA